jgi:trk system potassium uptake protein TrkH
MKPNPTLKNIGMMLLFLAGIMLLPYVIALYNNGGDADALLTTIAASALCGVPIFWLNRNARDLSFRDAVLIVTFGWFIVVFFGALPFYLHGAVPSFTNAYFEAMSGLTTTGSTILSDIEALPRGLLFWRQLMHFIGGMGMIGLYLLLFSYVGTGNLQMYRIESAPGQGATSGKIMPNIRLTMKWLWGIYILLNVVCAILLWLGGMSVYDAACHAFSTIATGGYSTNNASVGGFNSAYLDWVITLFMFLAGADFVLHYQALRGNWRALWNSTELTYYFLICFLLGMSVSFFLWWGDYYAQFTEAMRYGFFQVLSILTTTGYATADYELWSATAQLLIFFCLFIAACSGSTTSGIRIIHVVVFFRFANRMILRMARPFSVKTINVDGRALEMSLVNNILGLIALHLHMLLVGSVFITFVSPDTDWWSSFNVMIASLWNTGPAFGDIGPTENYAHLSDAATWFLSLVMLAGRLDILTIVILFYPSFWKSSR